VLLYSYGSGISATMLSLVGRPTTNPRFSLARLQAMVRGWGGSQHAHSPSSLCVYTCICTCTACI
jgi:hypothetical protein